MRARPTPGDRVKYVIMPFDPKRSKIYEAAEDPRYCVETLGAYPSQEWVIDNQLKKPITRALDPVIGAEQVHELFHGAHTRKRKVILPKTGGLSSFFLRGNDADEARDKSLASQPTPVAAAAAASAPEPAKKKRPTAAQPRSCRRKTRLPAFSARNKI